MTMNDRFAPLMPTAARPPAVMVRGEGSYLFDESGRRYLDFVQGWAVNALGHCPPELQEEVTRQAAELLNPSPAYFNAPQLELARRLVELSGLHHVFFCNSGAEANEGAIKLARKWGRLHKDGAYRIITTENSFHGRTLATMAASGKPGWDEIFPPPVEGFRKVPFGDVSAVEEAMDPETVAIMVEPIQGEAGVVVPPEGYLQGLAEVAERHRLLLILDEVQTGVGRTGSLFAFETEGVRPHILTLGKGLGGGVPLAALVADEGSSCFEHGEQGGTFNGAPLATAVGLRVLETVAAPSFLKGVRDAGARVEKAVRSAASPIGVQEVRGRGLLLAARLAEPVAEEVRDRSFEMGLLLNAPRPDLLRFMPSLRIRSEEIEEMEGLLGQACREVGSG